MTGEIIVAGLVTGTHLIEDIGVAVPHKVAVHIPADQALRSKDLWRGLDQGKLFKLDGGCIQVNRVPAGESGEIATLRAEVARLETENKRLKIDAETERLRADGFQTVLGGLEAQLAGVRQAIGKLGDLPRVVHVVQGTAAVSGPSADVVGGDAPTFIPDRIRPAEDVETQIRTETATAEKSNVSSAASKLREMKKGDPSIRGPGV